MSKTPAEVLEGLTDEQREMVLEGHKQLDGPKKEEQAPWTRMARKKLFASDSRRAGSACHGYWRTTEYTLTPLGKDPQALPAAAKRAARAALKDSRVPPTIPMWLLMVIAERDDDKLTDLIYQSGQGDQHERLSDLAMSIARGEA